MGQRHEDTLIPIAFAILKGFGLNFFLTNINIFILSNP